MRNGESHRAKCRPDARRVRLCSNPITSPPASTGGIHHQCRHPGPRSGASFINSNAFTLIELLVVIAIIVLLMAALLPALGRARAYARAVVCQSNLKEWGATLALYTEDSQGRLPTDTSGNSGLWLLRGVFLKGDDPNADPGALHHFGTRDIACCPMATMPSSGEGNVTISATHFGSQGGSQFLGTGGLRFNAWEIITPPPRFYGSYGYNKWLFKGFSQHPARMDGKLIELDVLSTRARADVPAVLDACLPWGSSDLTMALLLPPPTGEGNATFPSCINRHNGCVNGLFLDWSVRKIGLKELWTLYWYAEFDRAGPWTKAGGVKPEKWPKWMRSFKEY